MQRLLSVFRNTNMKNTINNDSLFYGVFFYGNLSKWRFLSKIVFYYRKVDTQKIVFYIYQSQNIQKQSKTIFKYAK